MTGVIAPGLVTVALLSTAAMDGRAWEIMRPCLCAKPNPAQPRTISAAMIGNDGEAQIGLATELSRHWAV